MTGIIQISVIVCTYNRADMLSRTLGSLVRQTLAKDLFEIIVVDNDSRDATPEVMREFLDMNQASNIVLVREDRLGLGYARNKGFRHVRGAYVAFIDDDSWAEKNWLRLALDCFERVNPAPLVVGGPIYPFYDSPGPAWFKDEYEIRTWGHESRFLKNGESFSGSNMIFRREAIEKYSGFDVSVGMKGDYLSVGEETSLFEKIWRDNSAGEGLYYSPELLVFHAVPGYKMTLSYQLKRTFVAGQTWSLRHVSKSSLKRLQLLLRIMFSIVKLSASSLAQLGAYPTYQNWIVESVAPVVSEIGRLASCLGLFIPVKQRSR